MFDSFLIIPALMAVGWLAAQVLPATEVSGEPYRPWTEDDFDYVVKRYLK